MTLYRYKNEIRLPVLLLCAVALSIAALIGHPLIPKKRLLITDSANDYDLASTTLPDKSVAGKWVGNSKRQFTCMYPENYDDSNYYCSWNRRFGWQPEGVDLSKFHTINIKIDYTGSAAKLRLFARNYNDAYSKRDDFNSTKYNAVFLPVAELKDEISLSLREFAVTEWWLLYYKIPRQLAMPELNNVVTLGVDFSYPMTPGLHEVTVEKIELVGDWISQKMWYLTILSLWLFGIFTYQLNQLRLARKQRSADSELIFTLNNDNKHLQEETSKFRRLSTVDLLTQTYNRFGIDQVVNALIAAKTHMSMPGEIPLFCLILFDIDYFKKVNDSYGHDVGDMVLQKISNSIQEELRPFDYLGRWGGEEFLIILPRTEMYVAFDLAEVLRKKLASTPIKLDSASLQLTASFGVASCWDGDYASAFKRVDDALYQAKHSGRNRTVIAEDRAEAGSS
jgi:diguanylate cyclase (GGDEF)-like protein